MYGTVTENRMTCLNFKMFIRDQLQNQSNTILKGFISQFFFQMPLQKYDGVFLKKFNLFNNSSYIFVT